MAMQLTRRDLTRALHHARSTERAAARHEGLIEKATEEGVRALTIGAGAFATGVAKGRFGAISLFGVLPADLLAGFGLHALGMYGGVKKYAGHIHDLANGVLASYASTVGAGFGNQWRVKSGAAPLGSTSWYTARTVSAGTELSGARGRRVGLSAGRTPLTSAELASMASAVRG